ncbi:hypothetical protein FCL53_13565 [Elizabethkingia meningoseptica]|uniref:zincin-like metallopeptidase toxin domain-containing protein n=1 Tax=Elizabethkingia meningoseptica TaxID=238 RepID=UPI0013663B6A|nr:zincin-like metallopeptidase toxin domain-containing protein [Elizabethkingia meningoseptica]MVW92994.1 hypothetical protein [Elizabethkingia meningoseptica]
MNYKESLNDFDERSKEILMASAKSIIPIQKLQQRDYGNFRDVMVDKVKLGETIRGMQNVSPLTEMKFFNQSADQIFSKYFPDGEETLKGNVTIIDDFNIVVKEGYKFSSYDYYFDNNHNGIYGDSGDTLAFRLLLFVSDDGNKVKECYEVVKPADDEVILFLESDKDTFSQDALYGKMSDKVRKQFTDKDGNLKSNLFDNEIMKTVQKHSDINQDIVAELMKNGYVENKSITKGFFIFLKYVMMGVSAPAKALGWIMNKIGDGIDFLKIPDKFWDTESEDYYFRKDSLIENLSIPTNKLNILKNLFTDKKGFNLADITPQLVDDIILKQISVLESFTEQYNNYVKTKIEEIFKNLENDELQKQTESLAEKVALICGIWNGLVDFISSTFKFISTLLEAPFDISKDFQYTFELVDNFLALLDENLLKNIDNAVSEGVKNIIEYLRSKNADDINFVRVHYLAGFTISFIGTFFIPVADVAKISEVGKVGEILTKINEEIGKTISQSAKFVKIQTAEVYQKAGKALQELLEKFAKGGKKLQDFVEKLWKEIAEWFLKNKKYIQPRYEEIVDITAKELDWMASRRIGNLGGNILKETQVRKLRGILKQKGIQLIVDGDTKAIVKLFMPIDNFKSFEELRLFMKNNNKVGLFHAGTKQMILTKNCTEIVAFHEMCHLKHFEEVGEIAYKGYSVVEKEMYVWKQLLSNRRKWTKAELDDSLNYINRERRKAGITEPIKIK